MPMDRTQPTPTAPTQTTRTPTTRTPIATASTQVRSSALARCIEPVAADEFLASYWEQRPPAVPRDEEGRFGDPLAGAGVERQVSHGGARYPAFRLVRDGGQIPRDEYTSDLPWRPEGFPGVADPGRIAALFEEG